MVVHHLLSGMILQVVVDISIVGWLLVIINQLSIFNVSAERHGHETMPCVWLLTATNGIIAPVTEVINHDHHI